MMTVTEFRTLDRLDEIRDTWNALHRQTPHACVLQSFEWYCDFIAQNNCEPRVLAVSLAGRTIGLLALVIRSSETSLGRTRVLTEPHSPWNSGVGVVGPNTAATLFAAMKHIGHRGDWDLVELTADSGGTRLRTVNAMKSARLSFGECETAKTGVVDTSTEWSQFWRTRGNDLHQRFQQAETRLGRLGELRFVRFRSNADSAAPRWDLFSGFLRAAHYSAFPAADGATLLSEKEKRELSRLHERAFAAGNVDLCLLTLNNRPFAGAYSLNGNGSVQALRIGWSLAATKDAVDVLVGHMLQDGFEQRDREFRFPTAPNAVSDWATHTETATRLTHYVRLKPRAQLLRIGRWLSGRKRAAASASRRYHGKHAPVPAPRLGVVG